MPEDARLDLLKYGVTVYNVGGKRKQAALRRGIFATIESDFKYVDYGLRLRKLWRLLKRGRLYILMVVGSATALWSMYHDNQRHLAEVARAAQTQRAEEAHRAKFAEILTVTGVSCDLQYVPALEMFRLPDPMTQKFAHSYVRVPQQGRDERTAVITGDGSVKQEARDANGRLVATVWSRNWFDQNVPKRWEGVWRTVYVFMEPGTCAIPPGVPGEGDIFYLDFAYNDPGAGKALLPPPQL